MQVSNSYSWCFVLKIKKYWATRWLLYVLQDIKGYISGPHRSLSAWELRAEGHYTHTRASQVTHVLKNPPASAGNKICRFSPWVRKIPWWRAATHSSILTWRIRWTEKPGSIQSIGLQRVGHKWGDLACVHTPRVFSRILISAFM